MNRLHPICKLQRDIVVNVRDCEFINRFRAIKPSVTRNQGFMAHLIYLSALLNQ